MLQSPLAMTLPEPKISTLHFCHIHHLFVPITIRAYLELIKFMTKSTILTKPRSELAHHAPLRVQHTEKNSRLVFATIEKLIFKAVWTSNRDKTWSLAVFGPTSRVILKIWRPKNYKIGHWNQVINGESNLGGEKFSILCNQ